MRNSFKGLITLVFLMGPTASFAQTQGENVEALEASAHDHLSFEQLDAKKEADIAALRRAIGALASDVRQLRFDIDSDLRAGRGGSYGRFAASDAQQLDFRASDLRRELAYVEDDPHRLRGEIQHFGTAQRRLSSRLWHSDWGFRTTNSMRRVERSFQLVESAFRRLDQ